jgi:transcriptional regulator with XRE-family HTH domain
MSESKAPYASLGSHLKYVREQAKQSLAEVSGAVEIEEGYLARIEAGIERPAEDILLLLISYFGVKDREAVQLWESAEYDSGIPDEIRADKDVDLAGKSMVMLLAMDTRTIYSDGLDIHLNPAGVTLSFTQSGKSQAVPAAKVGMSYNQAEQVVKSLEKALLHAKYNQTKLLPPPNNA